jgi:membrane dipeptidase
MDVLVMGLSYNLPTPFASGVMSRASTGLTALGREAVQRMNARGVTLDVSHSDEPSSLGALAASTKPVLITHAGCATVHPHPRNKSDRLMRALADKGGVMGIFELSYLTQRAQPSLAVYMRHMTHALKVCGEDHVGIGTDGLLTPFDTSPDSMAEWNKEIARRKASGVAAPGEGPPPFVVGLNRPDRSEVIAGELLRRGYSARVAEKVLGSNFLRVFRETWTG